MKKRLRLISIAALIASLGATSSAMAQASSPFLGQLILVGFNFCPYRWADANGQILSIQQYTALFSLYGTSFGGNGSTNFALPNLQGRIALGQGNGAGLPAATVGEDLGAPTTTLLISEMPAHTHQLFGTAAANSTPNPQGAALATFPPARHSYVVAPASQTMTPGSIGVAGSSVPFPQYQPTLVLRYCVAMAGVFPQRPQ